MNIWPSRVKGLGGLVERRSRTRRAMTIPNVSDERLKEILSENLTPSDTIKTPDRLFGREKMLQRIDRAFSSPGRQIFIYGDRRTCATETALVGWARIRTGKCHFEGRPLEGCCS